MDLNHEKKDKLMEINFIGKLTGVFINQFQLAILIIFMVISIGVVGLISLPKESLPEIVFPTITIQTVYPGSAPKDVELLVTEKIENKIKELEDIDKISSNSSAGFSVVTVQFKESVNIDNKKIEIDNDIRELSFPEGVLAPESFIFKTSEIPLMNISVTGNYNIEDLTRIAKNIKRQLEGVSGVDSVDLFGTTVSEIHIITDVQKMLTYNISMNDIRNALRAINLNLPVGDLELNGVLYSIGIDERLATIDDVKNVVVTGASGQQVFIKDLASVEFGIEEISEINKTYIGDGQNGSTNSVFMKVNRKINSDVLGTSERIINRIEEIKGIDYPDDVLVYISNNQAKNVTVDLNNIQSSAFSGLIVVIIVLFLFIGIRESLIVSITIPLSLLGTLGILNLFGITFNTFAILGLIVSLGLLVDNSIIVMENIDRVKNLGFTRKKAAFYGTNQVGFPIVSSTLTTLAAFFPLVILPGILGAFVSTIPLTIMITLTVSLFVSLIITPSIASRILRENSDVTHKKGLNLKNILAIISVAVLSYIAFSGDGNKALTISMMVIFTALMTIKLITIGSGNFEGTIITRLYGKLIFWIVERKRRSFLILIIGILILMSSSSTFSTGLLKIAFFPTNEPSSINILVDTPGGTTLEQSEAISKKIELFLQEKDYVTSYNVTVGGREIDSANFSISLDTSQVNGFDILDEIQSYTSNIAGAKISVDGIAAGPPVGKPIEIKIQGENIENTFEYSIKVIEALRGVEGVYNIESSVTVGAPQIRVNLNRLKINALGTPVNSVASQLRGELNGVEATAYRLGDEDIKIVIKRDVSEISDMNELKSLFIATQSGMMIPLKSIGDLEVSQGISNITRENGKRVISVSADLKRAFNSTEVTEIIKARLGELDTPVGVNILYGGDAAGIEENFGYLFQSMILAVFLVFIILTVQFKSILQPFVILTSIPMAVIGVIWGLVLTGNDFGFYAFMGLIALVGIAVNDAIVLIDYINFLRADGVRLEEAIIEAGLTRFNPVIATTLTTISGVLPLAFKEAYYAQFSFALIFGLMMTTIMTLIFVPTIYSLIERFAEKWRGANEEL